MSKAGQGRQLHIYGIHAVEAVLDNRIGDVSELHLRTRANERIERLAGRALPGHITVKRCSNAQLDRLVGGAPHQGVVATIRAPLQVNETALDALVSRLEAPLLLLLEQVQDPQNLGACLRVASAAGVDAVVVPRARSARLTPVVWKASAGAVEHLPIIHVASLVRTAQWLRAAGVQVVATAADAPQSCYQISLKGPLAVVVGNEGQGVSGALQRAVTDCCAIPMPGRVESLNVSTATAIVLYEALRQRQAG